MVFYSTDHVRVKDAQLVPHEGGAGGGMPQLFVLDDVVRQVVAELRKYYSELLFKVPISRTVRLSEAPGYGRPICYHDPYGKGSLEYAAVAKELMMRI